MLKPAITPTESGLILSYELANISCLKIAVDQVIEVLKTIVNRHDFFKIKKNTAIKVENGSHGKSGLRMHFLIPTKVDDPKVVENIIDGKSPTQMTPEITEKTMG